jgi:hypothetical protein
MKSALRAGLVGMLLLGAGCSSNGGFLGTGYLPKGDITITNPSSGAVITSSSSSPYNVAGATAFSIGIAETNFGGPYTVTMTGWTSGVNLPCYEPQITDTADHINTVLFSPVNAVTPGTIPDPCPGDTETAQISDGKGHTVYFYFKY